MNQVNELSDKIKPFHLFVCSSIENHCDYETVAWIIN